MKNDNFYKENENDKIWWKSDSPIGQWEFSFDKKTIYNMFRDYPDKLTKKQIDIFDKENPYWTDFFKDRKR